MKLWHWLIVGALGLWTVMSWGQVPSSRIDMGDQYRLEIEFNNVAVDSTLRFPRKQLGTNSLLAETSPTTDRTYVNWVHLTYLTGNPNDIIWYVWSPAFPAGKDTLRLSTGARTYSFGGCRIDSLRYINPGILNNMQILVTD